MGFCSVLFLLGNTVNRVGPHCIERILTIYIWIPMLWKSRKVQERQPFTILLLKGMIIRITLPIDLKNKTPVLNCIEFIHNYTVLFCYTHRRRKRVGVWSISVRRLPLKFWGGRKIRDKNKEKERKKKANCKQMEQN